MEKEILDILKLMQNDMKSMQDDIKSVQSDMKSMQNDIKSVQSDMKSVKSELKDVKMELKDVKVELNDVNERLKKVEIQQQEDHQILKALEHRSEVNKSEHDKMSNDIIHIKGEVESIKKDMCRVEEATANNWADIAKLKGCKLSVGM